VLSSWSSWFRSPKGAFQASGHVIAGSRHSGALALNATASAPNDERAFAMVRPMLRADAIVLLGCRIVPSGRLAPPAIRRAKAAANAYLGRVAPIVVVSGGRRWGTQIEARALSAALVRTGVPRKDIIEELWSLSTYENAVFSAAVLRRLGARRVAIVTCPWHMPRALDNFRRAGVDAQPLPTEAAPAPPWTWVYRRAHERMSRFIDARRHSGQGGRILTDAASRMLDGGAS